MKKIWSLILAVLLIVSIVPISAVATAVENVEWIMRIILYSLILHL